MLDSLDTSELPKETSIEFALATLLLVLATLKYEYELRLYVLLVPAITVDGFSALPP